MYAKEMMVTRVAILVDGGFYLKRAKSLLGEVSPEQRAKELWEYCMAHLDDKRETRKLYRIFYYDCPPLDKKLHHPLTQRAIDLGKSDTYKWMNAFFDELKTKCRLALRLGKLVENQVHYGLKAKVLKDLCKGKIKVEDLAEEDFTLDITQKGVDMKIGLDIATLAHKKQVDQIVLISGDSDFVPAAKHARREGIDFILDSLQAKIRPDLQEHIDGARTHLRLLKKRDE